MMGYYKRHPCVTTCITEGDGREDDSNDYDNCDDDAAEDHDDGGVADDHDDDGVDGADGNQNESTIGISDPSTTHFNEG